MRNKILMLSAAAATIVAMATPASAHYYSKKNAPLVAGVVVGTVVGIGIHQAWWGSSLGGAALPTSVGGAVAGGFIAGVGTAALIHAATTPCTGFAAVFSPFAPHNAQGCVNGKYVGYKGHRVVRARY
jgi:hypothetical protein